MLRKIVELILVFWGRLSDASVFAWLFPYAWTKFLTGVAGVTGSLIGIIGGLPFYLWIPLGLITMMLAVVVVYVIVTLVPKIFQKKPEILKPVTLPPTIIPQSITVSSTSQTGGITAGIINNSKGGSNE